MVAPIAFEWIFRDVHVVKPDLVYLCAQNEDYLDQEDDEDGLVSYALAWRKAWASRPIPTLAISVCHIDNPTSMAIFLGTNGVVVRVVPGRESVPEVIDETADGPQFIGDLREIRNIGAATYVCGMGRTVYRCAGLDPWHRIDQSIREDSTIEDSDAGLNSIDGFDESAIFAVGWNGEIWSYNSLIWKQEDSPTNLALLKVLCASDGTVVIGAQGGLLLRGNPKNWIEYRIPNSNGDITGLAEFLGCIYIATSESLYIWDENGIEPVDLSRGKRKIETRPHESFGSVHAAAGVLWSVGPKMAIYTKDGKLWEECAYF
jgi:hypothetical protein